MRLEDLPEAAELSGALAGGARYSMRSSSSSSSFPGDLSRRAVRRSAVGLFTEAAQGIISTSALFRAKDDDDSLAEEARESLFEDSMKLTRLSTISECSES